MADTKTNKHVLVKVKDLKEEELDAAIDAALDALFGKDEEEKSVPARKKPSLKRDKTTTKRKG